MSKKNTEEIYTEYDNQLLIKDVSQASADLFGISIKDYYNCGYSDLREMNQHSFDIKQELTEFQRQDEKVLQGQKLSILDGHFYPQGFKAFYTWKFPIFNSTGNKIIGIRAQAFPIQSIFEPEIKILLKSHYVHSSEKVKKNFNEYFERSHRDLFEQKYGLSQREVDCLYWLSKGFTYSMIAKRLYVSSRTIEFYMSNIKTKLGCISKEELIEKIYLDSLL